MWKHKISLGQWVESIVHGQPVRSVTWNTVFANKKSVRQSEFYSAANVGLRPEVVFEIHAHEYKGHEMVKFSGVEHTIVRTYENGEIVELVCTSQVGDMSG